MRFEFSFLLFLMDFQSLHHHFFEKTIHPPLNSFASLSKIISVYLCGVISEFPILFHGSLCLILRQYQALCQELYIHYLWVLHQLQGSCSNFIDEEVNSGT